MIFLLFACIVLLFGFVLLFGAPYLPTKKVQIDTALNLLDLKPGNTLYEFGCGDGRVLKAAAQRDLYAVGYELNPILVVVAYIVTWKYRKRVHIVWGNFWKADVSEADGVFVFLLDKYMKQLDRKLIKEGKKGLRLASFAFKIPAKKVVTEKQGIFLYRY